MTLILSNQDLSDGVLKLYLSNDLGQQQDASLVKWSIYDSSGNLCSGKDLDAVKEDTGVYFASWMANVVYGNYKIVWSVKENLDSNTVSYVHPFYVANPDLSFPFDNKNISDGYLTFQIGEFLDSSDLFIVLKDDDGFNQDAHVVTWYIADNKGCQLTQKVFAVRESLGVYYAPWVVSVNTGSYQIIWEYQKDSDSPLQSKIQNFSVIGNLSPFIITFGPDGETPVTIIGYDKSYCYDSRITAFKTNTNPIYSLCSSSIPNQPLSIDFQPCRGNGTSGSSVCIPTPIISNNPSTQCGNASFEIARQIHLSQQVLPNFGIFTNQTYFQIPSGIKRITFYITYSRGDVGGQPVFHLLWGNGTEEIIETILDTDLEFTSTTTANQGLYLQDLYGPTPVDSNPVSFILYATVPGGSTTVRLTAAEKGNVQSPGTILITLTAST